MIWMGIWSHRDFTSLILAWGDNCSGITHVKGCHVANGKPIAWVDIWQTNGPLWRIHVPFLITDSGISITLMRRSVFIGNDSHARSQGGLPRYRSASSLEESLQHLRLRTWINWLDCQGGHTICSSDLVSNLLKRPNLPIASLTSTSTCVP